MAKITLSQKIRRIGLVSDTHIPTRRRVLPRPLFRVLYGVDLIIHAGDLVDETVLTDLGELAPVEAVAGNMDPPDLVARLSRQKLIEIAPVRIGVIHGDVTAGLPGIFGRDLSYGTSLQIIVCGHTHIPKIHKQNGLLWINPGSPVDPRSGWGPTCALVTIEDENTLLSQIIEL